MRRRGCLLALLITILVPASALAQGGDVTVFGGIPFPTYSEQVTFATPSPLSFPGFEVTGDPFTLDATGGTVVGVAAAFELGGFFGIEGRFDSASITLNSSGVRYAVAGGGLSGSIAIGEGPVPVDRLTPLSANLRLRIPGPVSVVASGGFSYLPKFEVGGTFPLTISVPGLPNIGTTIPLRLVVRPTDKKHKFGWNGGIGLRIAVAPHFAIVGEARGFYFPQYELFVQAPGSVADDILSGLGPVRFNPVIFNVVGGVSFVF